MPSSMSVSGPKTPPDCTCSWTKRLREWASAGVSGTSCCLSNIIRWIWARMSAMLEACVVSTWQNRH